jgi:hypothetical protein
MIKELDSVVLKRDLPEEGLKAGDLGAVVHLYETADAYEVEFVRADGRTVALVTLTPADVRRMMGDEILHVRRLAS